MCVRIRTRSNGYIARIDYEKVQHISRSNPSIFICVCVWVWANRCNLGFFNGIRKCLWNVSRQNFYLDRLFCWLLFRALHELIDPRKRERTIKPRVRFRSATICLLLGLRILKLTRKKPATTTGKCLNYGENKTSSEFNA